MEMYRTHSEEILFLRVLCAATDYNQLLAINTDEIQPYLNKKVTTKNGPDEILNLLFKVLSGQISKHSPIEVINEFADNMIQLLIVTDSEEGLMIPNTVNGLCRVLEVYDYFLTFGLKDGMLDLDEGHTYRVDLTRLIDASMPVDRYTRMVYSYLLRTPH